MSASLHLKSATAEAHGALERTNFASDLKNGNLELAVYVDYLRAVAVIIANLRTAIRRDGTEILRGLLPILDDWVERITGDIAHLGSDDGLANPYAQAACLRHTQKLFRIILDDPAWVYGLLYVIFGSHGGNRIVATAVARELGLGDVLGTSYLRALDQESSLWTLFKARLDDEIDDPAALDSATKGALETFETFYCVFDALAGPYQRGVQASAVNPEAGDHPMPKDENLVRLGNETGRRVFAEFGYLEMRYGKRGEAFTASDGAWMITLGDLPMARAFRQIDWLTQLLSARGIPSYCVEHHLKSLHHALDKERALPGDDPDRFLKLARRVAVLRESMISSEDWEEFCLAPLPSLDPLGTVTLLSAAVDQRVGLARCADSMIQWLKSESEMDQDVQVQLVTFLETVSNPAGTLISGSRG